MNSISPNNAKYKNNDVLGGTIVAEKSVEANQKISDTDDGSRAYGGTKGLSEAETANIELEKEFYRDDSNRDMNESTPYIYNNTPAIKIRK